MGVFRQNETYDSRLSKKSGTEKYVYLYKNESKGKQFDNINRSTIAQLGIARAKLYKTTMVSIHIWRNCGLSHVSIK